MLNEEKHESGHHHGGGTQHEHHGEHHHHHHEHHHGPATVTVKVFAPSILEPKEFTWPDTMKVADAALEAAHAFGVTTEAPTFQNERDEILNRDQSLIADGVHECETLELVSAGGGV